jgi:hypothetical protein
MSKIKKIILIFLLIAVILLLASIWWIQQRNIASRGDLLLELIAPESVVVGQTIQYTLRLKNQGNFTLYNPELLFEFPRHANPIEPEQMLVRRKLEDDIYPGQEQQLVFEAKIFGQEKETLTARARVDYQVQGLKAHYSAETSATTAISSVPLTLEISLPQTVSPGRDFQFSINYFSALDETLENIGIKLTATRGFLLQKSIPDTTEPGEWAIPFLISQDGGRIRLTGNADPEVPEIVLHAQLGVWTEQGFATLKRVSRKIEVSDAPMHLSFQVNGSFDYVANPGDSLHYQVYFRNVTERPLENQFLTVNLKGDYFDLASLRSTRGTYQPGHSSILWDWREIPELRFLDRDEEGQVDFWIDLKEGWPIRSLSPQVELEAEIGSIRQSFATKINSEMELTQRVYANNEFFFDEGFIPFQLGQMTKYTVFWELGNNYNMMEDVWVAAYLPPETMFADQVFPEEEMGNLSFQPNENRLVWDVGQLEPGQKAILAFQLVAIPQSVEALGGPLMGPAEVQGRDSWTEQIVSSSALEVNEVSEMEQELEDPLD